MGRPAKKKQEMPEVMRAEHVAAVLGLSPWTVYELWRRGRMPCFRVGRRVRMRREWLIQWMDEQRLDMAQ